jgi:chromosome segregation ATPase
MLASAMASEVTPVQKVIQLLNGMVEKGKNEKHAEQVQFASYKQWCDDTSVEKQRAIKEGNARIEKLNADIQKAEADAARLGREIAQHDEDISVFQGDVKAATKVREIENTDYLATHKDYSESIDALERAISVLKSQNYDRKQAALLQAANAALMPAKARKAIMAFLSQPSSDPLDVRAPDANGYEFQSQGVIDMLQKLLDKFADERDTLQKEETNSRHAFEMLIQDLNAQIATNTDAREEKSAAKGAKLQAAADGKGDLADTTATRDDDQKYLTDVTATCEQKAGDFENRQQLRADEIEAVEKAIEILSSGAVSGNADKHLPALVQRSFAQLRASSKQDSDKQIRVADFLRNEGDRLGSRVLSALAVRASADPFAKVKKMIKDLVVRLMEEANEEAEHKGWCDTELATNEQTRKEKTSAVETLHAEIDELTASIAKLGQDITDLTTAVAELDKAVAEATKIREDEHAKNTETVKDAQDAQTAVTQALTVLKEFYAKAGEATSLLQQPEIFDSAYKGMQSENGGVIGMIEVIQSDFARLESETSASEAQAQNEYDEFMKDSAVDKAQKSTDIEHKTAKRQNQEQANQEKKSDLEGTQKELDAALAYYDKLKPSCIDSGVSYEDRVRRREEEIQSLKEALRILNGEDIA